MKKTIITVVGNDTVGIIAKVCTYLADNNVNILDISQTIVQGYFNMMMIADTSGSEKDAATISKELSEIGGINKTIKYKRKNKWKDSISREYPGDTFHNFLHYILPSSFSCKQYIILGPGKQPKSENIKNS